jgi:tRNA-dihydrouridine synthase B
MTKKDILKKAQTKLQLGSLILENSILYAPLAGCSDFPFRKMSTKYRPGLIYCEMVKMDALIRHDPNTYHLLDYSTDMHPIGAQLCGSKPKIAGQAAKIVEDLGFDVVDLNCGCPVDKITKDGSGSGMLKTPDLIGEIIAEIVAAVKIPVTVKIRGAWDDRHVHPDERYLAAMNIAKIAEQAGAKAICVHGRTREQGYRGPANWEYIKACKEAVQQILVIGNGDVLDGPSAEQMFVTTGCDAVLVARGTLGQPWIIQDILDYLSDKAIKERGIEEYRQALYDHFMIVQQYHSDSRVCVDMRRIGCWYFKKSAGTKQFRELISRAQSMEEVRQLILHFPFTTEDDNEEQVEEAIDCC